MRVCLFRHTFSHPFPFHPLPQRRPTATLADLCPSDRAKLARLLRRTLALATENASLRAAASDNATTADARYRTTTALDAATAATTRAEAAEHAMAAARAACVCGACAGVAGGEGGADGAAARVAAVPTPHGRALVFDPRAGPGGAYVFAQGNMSACEVGKGVAREACALGEENTAPAPAPARPDLATLVTDVEAALARRGW